MAIAGRVAIVPKGDWSADATYKRLDAVTYNNTLYFAKKEVPAGTATSNTEYWSKSIVGGAGAIATKEDAGIVKPADGLSIAEDGTLKVSIDCTTLTMDQVNNVIKLADTLKDKIGSALQPESIVNNQVTTETGYALDARQANPNLDGTLAKQISDLNGSLKGNVIVKPVESPFSGNVAYIVKNGICMVSLWGISAPTGAFISARLVTNMPDTAIYSGTLGESAPGAVDSGIFIFINPGTNFIECHKAEGCNSFYAYFCYPVKL